VILAASVFEILCGKADRQTDRQTDKQTNKQTNKHMNAAENPTRATTMTADRGVATAENFVWTQAFTTGGGPLSIGGSGPLSNKNSRPLW